MRRGLRDEQIAKAAISVFEKMTQDVERRKKRIKSRRRRKCENEAGNEKLL